MSLLKDSAIFKSSGLFLLSSPTAHSIPTKDNNMLTNSNFFSRPQSKGAFNPRQIQQQQQIPHGHHVQQLFQEKLPLLPQLNTSQQQVQGSASAKATRKNSLISKNMSTEQLKDWLIGKQPSQPNLHTNDRNQNQVNSYAINTQSMIASPTKAMEFLNVNKTINIVKTKEVKPDNEEKESLATDQTQERKAVRRTQRRAQSDIIFQRKAPSTESTQQVLPIEPLQSKSKNSDDSDEQEKSEENQASSKTRIIIRKRQRMPSFNPTTVSMFDMQAQQRQQQQQQQLQQQQQQNQQNQLPLQSNSDKSNDQIQQQPQINDNESIFRQSRSTLFATPNKINRLGYSSAEPSPMKASSTTHLMETSQIGFNKAPNSSLVGSSNTITIPSSQSSRNLTSRQILLKDLQNITDSRKLLQISSNLTPLNTKLGNSLILNSQQDQLNQQIGKKLTIFNSPLSAASSPLDEVLSATTTTSSQNGLPMIKNRQIKNISLQNIDMPQKLLLHPTSTKSSVIQSVWGSSSSLESSNELHQQQISQAQPKGILKNKREPSKSKKCVVFDKKLHIHELGQEQQA